jgi:hypothetical protein
VNVLGYHKPESPKSEARLPFRIGAWVMFLLCLAPLCGGLVALWHAEYDAATILLIPSLWGCWMFGSIAIFGRLYRPILRR